MDHSSQLIRALLKTIQTQAKIVAGLNVTKQYQELEKLGTLPKSLLPAYSYSVNLLKGHAKVKVIQ